jgi:hypothetical protein
MVILPAPDATNDATPPSPVALAPNAMGGDPDDSGDESGEHDDEDNNNNDGEDSDAREDNNPRYHRTEYHKHTVLRMRMASFVSYWRKCCNIWVSL